MDKHIENIVAKFKKELSRTLPGNKAQLKMAPSYRHLLPMDIKDGEAGVLILIYVINKEFYTIFMKRQEYPGVHSGQISFPGGMRDLADKNIRDTALRETEEEFGIPSNHITVLGKLTPLLIPVSKIEVHPFVGFINREPLFKPDPREVNYLIETKINALLDTTIIKSKLNSYKDMKGSIPYYDVHGHEIWGATAMILSEFLEIAKKII